MSLDFLFQIGIHNPKPVDVNCQFVTFAVPVPKGQLLNQEHLIFCDEQVEITDCQFVTAAQWPDGSIKLMHASALVTLSTLETKTFFIKNEVQISKKHHQTPTTSTGRSISHGDMPSQLCTIHTKAQEECGIGIHLLEQEQQPFSARLITQHPKITTIKPLVQNTVAGFDFQCNNLRLPIQLYCSSEFIFKTGQLNLSVTIRNPNAAKHPGGTWDLGDANSFHFSELSVAIKHLKRAHTLKVENGKTLAVEKDQKIVVTQQGSGGVNWQSPVHIDKDNLVDVDGPGYIIEQSKESIITENVINLTGQRASPIAVLGNDKQQCAIYTENFWQNFPSSFSIQNELTTIGLFPFREGKSYELQPGEQKTYKIVIQNFNDHSQAIEADSPLTIIYPENVFADSMLLPLLKHDAAETALETLIKNGLKSENDFFIKREKLDEYGWRNFGELFADHETEGYEGSDIFVSHYNNQYDPIYGFLRQYLNTGEHKWFELADDLANHVIDIDIYHTEEDKSEYNGGLFWHTDHYCSANTATHRTYSIKQNKGIYDGHAGGGGPGGQHCYTTGLMLHYWLTGNEQSKQTVLRLAQWISSTYEGSGTVVETLLALKNQKSKEIKNILTEQYPLDRGTANYVVATLDTYQLSSQQRYLDRAGKILKSTLSATDKIGERDLKDVENTWFYTVLLQAVCRYLLVKQAAGQIDSSFSQMRAALVHYASYMLDHESPYLTKPEILEFPNQTWTGQDLRKSNVFYAANFFCTSNELKQKFLAKGEHFYRYVTKTLENEPSVFHTRIQALLMQNSGYMCWFKEISDAPKCLTSNSNEKIQTNHSVINLLLNVTRYLNIKHELQWLRKRSAKIDRILSMIGIH